MGIELTGKTAGVIGLGRIGTAMAERLSGLGMKVQYWSANSSDKNYRKVPLEELMKTSDVILPALARNDETKGLISDEMIRSMKKTAIFASVVHEVYNHKLLLGLAEQGAIYGYGFESGQQEVSSYSGNVWAGPDLAWYTNSSVSANAIQWIDSIVSASRGQFPTRVN